MLNIELLLGIERANKWEPHGAHFEIQSKKFFKLTIRSKRAYEASI